MSAWFVSVKIHLSLGMSRYKYKLNKIQACKINRDKMFVCVLESWGSWGTFWQSGGKKGPFSGFRRGWGWRGLLRDLDRFASEQNGQPLVMTSGWGARIQLVDKITNSVLLPSISIFILGKSKSLLAISSKSSYAMPAFCLLEAHLDQSSCK